MRAFFFISILFLSLSSPAQKTITFLIKDAASGEALPNVSATLKGAKGVISDAEGKLALASLANGATITFSSVGYEALAYAVSDTTAAVTTILLQHKAQEGEEVIVSSSRTESRIENLPTKVEVIGLEEVEEEAGVKPGNIASLLGDVAGIQSQQTSAVSGNTELRVQGLPGKYTQLLRDGMPLFGDFAGSFSILQIPPLDLKQIEIIKGASSTLYGGGAIAGMINLVTKRPVLGKPERSVLLNYSTLNEANANVYLSNRNQKVGYTFFSGTTQQGAVDVNKDGFTDVAKTKSYFLHPVLYLYPSQKSTFSIGYNGTAEDRTGGNIDYVRHKNIASNPFYIENNTVRHTGDVQWENRISNSKRFTVKAIGSWFNRDISAKAFGSNKIKARQLSYYSEAAYVTKLPKNDLAVGVNFNGETINPQDGTIYIPEEQHNTIGLFAQNDWRLHPKLTVQTGLRTDFNSKYGTFVLPRISLLYRISPAFTSRLGGGLGYKVPSVFEGDIDERDYPYLQSNLTKAEQSYGGNLDINFHKKLGDMELTINQAFYTTTIENAVVATKTGFFVQSYNTPAGSPVVSKGAETYVQVNADELEIYLGYTLVDAIRKYDGAHPHVPLSARNKFASVISYEFSERFRACIEAAATGRQYLDDGTRTPAYLFAAAMIRYDIKGLSLVLNCENLLDYRQSRKQSLYTGSFSNPHFKDLWAPIDGRVINLSARLRF